MITHHVPLRSNMSGLLAHISAGPHRKNIFTRTEIINQLNIGRIREDWLERRRQQLFAKPIHARIANVRKLAGGFKVVGILPLLDFTERELKLALKERGYTGFRRGQSPVVNALR